MRLIYNTFRGLIPLLFTTFSMQVHAEVVLITHISTTETEISLNVARAMFAMRKSNWSDGKRITVFVLKDDEDPVHKQFVKTTLNFFPYQLRKAWDRRVFSGTGESPQQVNTIEEMIEAVGKLPGSIGYYPDEISGNQVKTLKITGKY